MNLIPIGRAFASEQDALESVEALESRRFLEEDMSVITPAMVEATNAGLLTPAEVDGVPSRKLLAQLIIEVHAASSVPDSHAMVYADAIQNGKTLLLITAPFGQAQLAEATLDEGKAVDMAALPELQYHTWMQAAPLSDLLKIPVLKSRRSWMARTFPELRDADALPTRGLLGGLLKHDPAPLSSKFGMDVLKDNPTPLSSRVGMSVLKDNPTPLSSKVGMSVLTHNPAPLSEKTGMSALWSSRPAKKDSSFGLPLLLNNPTPLSSLFGISTLKKPD